MYVRCCARAIMIVIRFRRPATYSVHTLKDQLNIYFVYITWALLPVGMLKSADYAFQSVM